ncbi:MAG: NlpC/P60 family protein [Bacillota bacterium]
MRCLRKLVKIIPVVVTMYLCAGLTLPVQARAAAASLKAGARGPDVVSLQQGLQVLGYYRGPIDGIFGAGTADAVKSFQRQHGLVVDGVAGSNTLSALGRAMAAASGSRYPADSAQLIVTTAKSLLGVKYSWGGHTPKGFDCSGFAYYVVNAAGVPFPRDIQSQFKCGIAVERRELMPGDLVFFTTYAPGPSHVGIYLGDGEFIHASSARGQVVITPLTKQYYAKRFIGARRPAK